LDVSQKLSYYVSLPAPVLLELVRRLLPAPLNDRDIVLWDETKKKRQLQVSNRVLMYAHDHISVLGHLGTTNKRGCGGGRGERGGRAF